MKDMRIETEDDITKIEADVKEKSADLAQIRTMDKARNLTATNDLEDIRPVGDRIVVSLKAWPSQSVNGVYMPESYTVIRGAQYVTEVVAVGEKVTVVEKGDIAVVSMYSGHHITTRTGHAKIISETDILNYKKGEDMKKTLSFDPKTFRPGINYILVEVIEKKTVRSKGGVILEVGDDEAANKMDVATKTGKVISIGPTNEYGKSYSDIKPGTTIIFDAYVGMPMNTAEITDSEKYIVMFSSDILGFVSPKQ